MLFSSITRKQPRINPSGRGWVIFASNQSRTSLREKPRKAVGDEVIEGEDPLAIVAISLVSTMTSQSDACVAEFSELNWERYSSVHSKRRSRVCRARIEENNVLLRHFLRLTVVGISAVQNTGHRVLSIVGRGRIRRCRS